MQAKYYQYSHNVHDTLKLDNVLSFVTYHIIYIRALMFDNSVVGVTRNCVNSTAIILLYIERWILESWLSIPTYAYIQMSGKIGTDVQIVVFVVAGG
jgi:hypothetical protein